MRSPTLAELVKRPARFVRFEDGNLYYAIEPEELPIIFEFPISVFSDHKGGLSDDVGGVFLPEMKGISLMRWIRKHLELINGAKKEHETYLEGLSGEEG
jgi:hypothetical protein